MFSCASRSFTADLCALARVTITSYPSVSCHVKQDVLNLDGQGTHGLELAAVKSSDGRGEKQKFWGRRKKLTLSSSESSDEEEGLRHGGGREANGGAGSDAPADFCTTRMGGHGDMEVGISTFLGEGAFEMIEELTLSRAECTGLKNEIQRLQKRVENESARSEALQAKIMDEFSQVSFSGNV